MTALLDSDGSAFGLMEDGSSIAVTTSLPAGYYQAVLLRAGINRDMYDLLCDTSDERYWLLLTTTAAKP